MILFRFCSICFFCWFFFYIFYIFLCKFASETAFDKFNLFSLRRALVNQIQILGDLGGKLLAWPQALQELLNPLGCLSPCCLMLSRIKFLLRLWKKLIQIMGRSGYA